MEIPKTKINKQEFKDELETETVKTILDKVLLEPKPSLYFKVMLEEGYIKDKLPVIYDLVGLEQSKEHHPEGDVWSHTLLVLDEASKLKHKSKNPRYFMYSALLHDIGKKVSYRYKNGKHTFFGHDKEGVVVSENFLKGIKAEDELIRYVKDIVLNHMEAHKLLEVRDKTLLKLMYHSDIKELLLIAKSDTLGRGTGELSKNKSIEDYTLYETKVRQRIRKLSNGNFGEVLPYFKSEDLINLGYKSEDKDRIKKLLEQSLVMQLGGDSKEKITRFLETKLGVNKEKNDKEKVGILLEKTCEELVKNNKEYKTLLKKRINYYIKTIEDYNKFHNTSFKLNYKTTQKGYPYIELNLKEGRLFFTPIFILFKEKDTLQDKVIVNVLDRSIKTRTKVIDNIFKEISKTTPKHYLSTHITAIHKLYGRLS